MYRKDEWSNARYLLVAFLLMGIATLFGLLLARY